MDSKEIKSTVVFMCAMNPHPVTKIKGVSVRAGRVFVPAVSGKAKLDMVREYDVDFPLSIADVDNIERFEALRKSLHERIDKAFDGYLENWDKISQSLTKQEGKTLKEVLEERRKQKEEEKKEDDKSEQQN